MVRQISQVKSGSVLLSVYSNLLHQSSPSLGILRLIVQKFPLRLHRVASGDFWPFGQISHCLIFITFAVRISGFSGKLGITQSLVNRVVPEGMVILLVQCGSVLLVVFVVSGRCRMHDVVSIICLQLPLRELPSIWELILLIIRLCKQTG